MTVKNQHGLTAFIADLNNTQNVNFGEVVKASPLWQKPIELLKISVEYNPRGNKSLFLEETISGGFGLDVDGGEGVWYLEFWGAPRKKNGPSEKSNVSPYDLGKLWSEINQGALISYAICLASEREIAISAIKLSVANCVQNEIDRAIALRDAAIACIDGGPTPVEMKKKKQSPG